MKTLLLSLLLSFSVAQAQNIEKNGIVGLEEIINKIIIKKCGVVGTESVIKKMELQKNGIVGIN